MGDEGNHPYPQVSTPSRGVCSRWLRRCPGSRCAKETLPSTWEYAILKKQANLLILDYDLTVGQFQIMTWQCWCLHMFSRLHRLAQVWFFFFFFCPEGFPYCDIPNLPTCSPWMGVILGLLAPNCVHCNNVPQLLLLIFLLSKETGQSGWLMGQLSMKKPTGVLGGSSAVEWADLGMSSWFWVCSSGRCPRKGGSQST